MLTINLFLYLVLKCDKVIVWWAGVNLILGVRTLCANTFGVTLKASQDGT